jgi:hypothetical protein
MKPSLLQIVLSVLSLCLLPVVNWLDRFDDWIRGTYRNP